MIINAPLEVVWQTVRQFDGVVNWNPGVTGARMESGSSTEVGHIRHLDIVDNTVFRETLLAHSDIDHSYTYDIVEGPLPVTKYVSTHRFLPITHSSQTLGIWEGWFQCDEGMANKLDKIVGDDIYIGGMTGLNEFVSGSN